MRQGNAASQQNLPQMTEAMTTLLTQADAAVQARQWDAAADSYQRLLKDSPDSVEACRKLANVLAIRGRYKATVMTTLHIWEVVEAHNDLAAMEETVDRLLELQPDNEDLWSKKVEVYWRQGKKEEAVALSRDVANVALARGQDDMAVDLLQRAWKEAPTNLELGLQLGEAQLSHGRIQEAAKLYKHVAKTYLEQNELDKAADAFKRMSVFAPGDMQILLILADLYANLGRYPEAEQYYRGMLKVDINHVEGLLGLARVSHFKGQYRDAILALNRILQTHPDEVRAHERLGEVYKIQGLTQDSTKHYLMAALACVDCGSPRKAQQFYKAVLEQDPRNTMAMRGLHELEGKV